MSEPEQPISVDFHFDVLCPYAYQTSKWIRSVRDQTDLTINWRFFSLEEINRVEGKKHAWEREWTFGWSLMRIAALLRRTDMDQVDRWYAIAGKALHEDGNRPHDPSVARHLLGQLGLDPELVDQAIADPTTHDEVRADHDRVVAAGGYGVPTLFFGDHCLFGPVLIDPPTGAAALRLWAAVTAWTEFPDVFELQQPKTRAIQQRIVETLSPYMEARDWVSINRGVEVGFSDEGFTVVGAADRDRSADAATPGSEGAEQVATIARHAVDRPVVAAEPPLALVDTLACSPDPSLTHTDSPITADPSVIEPGATA